MARERSMGWGEEKGGDICITFNNKEFKFFLKEKKKKE